MATTKYSYPFNNTATGKFINGNGQWADVYTKSEVDTIVGGVTPEFLTEVTYSELTTLISDSELVPGMFYRITDFVTTTSTSLTDVQSAEHPFDIIVMALDSETLSEDAKAIQHSGDTYFSSCNLNAWEIKYCVGNDQYRFDWARTTGGKGVIYYMKDEHSNECPYDFKNIKFKRGITNKDYDARGNDTFVYTFTWIHDNDVVDDASIGVASSWADIANNTIQTVNSNDSAHAFALPNNVIIVSDNYNSGSFYGIYGNKFGVGCHENTLTTDCNYNIFAANNHHIVLLNGSSNNVFEDNVTDVTFQTPYARYIRIEAGNKYISIDTTATPDESNNVMNFTIAKGVNDTTPVKTISHNTLNDAFKTIYQTQSSTTVNV